MGLLDGLLQAGRGTGGLLSSFTDRLANMPPEQNQFILDMGMGMLANQDPTRSISAMQSLGVGYTKARESQRNRRRDQLEEGEYQQSAMTRRMQHDTSLANLTKLQQRNDAMNRITEGYKADSTYKPNMGDLLLADPDSALRLMAPSPGLNTFGLTPKIGTNPETGEDEYFSQDRQGNPKWSGIKPPKNYRYVPGNDYREGQVFDPRSGGLQAPIGGIGMVSPGSQSQSGPGAAPPAEGFPSAQGGDGAPSPAAPWSNLQSPKAVDALKQKAYEQDNKRLDEMREAFRTGRATLADLDRFGELNRDVGTGSLPDRLGLPTLDPNKKEMEAIVARLGPRQRVPGSGATSDFDAKLLLGGLPSVANYGDANKQIREGYSTNLTKAEAELNFYQQYFTQNGHLNGAEQAFQQTLKKDPPKKRPPTPQSWQQINQNYAAGAGERQDQQLVTLQAELAGATDPVSRAALMREISRAKGGQSTQARQPAPVQKVMRGQVMDGFRFKGGDPGDRNSWEKM